MILPDLNLLIYAHNGSSRFHDDAYSWMREVFLGPETVGIPWAVALGYVRILSNPKLSHNPDMPADLVKDVQSWAEFPNVRFIGPGVRHLRIVESLFRESGCTGRMTTDVHLAALAIELEATLYSNDTDFGRFKGLTWKNPLA